MRVLHFYKTYLSETVGGIEQVIFQLCESSGSWGIDNHVLTLSSDPHPPVVPFGGHVVHRARLDLQLASTGFSLSVFKQFRELAAEADVVNYHFPWPFMDLVHFLTGMNKPSVVTYHSDIIRQRVLLKLYRPLMGRFLHSVDRGGVAQLLQHQRRAPPVPGKDPGDHLRPGQGLLPESLRHSVWSTGERNSGRGSSCSSG